MLAEIEEEKKDILEDWDGNAESFEKPGRQCEETRERRILINRIPSVLASVLISLRNRSLEVHREKLSVLGS